MSTAIRLLVGLGNPGAEYEQTRHNAGADCVSFLADALGAPLKAEKKFFGRLGRASVGGEDLRLLIPETFYNATGRAVLAVAQFYRIPLENIALFHDELDLPRGWPSSSSAAGTGAITGFGIPSTPSEARAALRACAWAWVTRGIRIA